MKRRVRGYIRLGIDRQVYINLSKRAVVARSFTNEVVVPCVVTYDDKRKPKRKRRAAK